MTDDVPAYDRAKLRLLNGAHSTLAYVGTQLGYETVALRNMNAAINRACLDHDAGHDRPTFDLVVGAALASLLRNQPTRLSFSRFRPRARFRWQ